MRRDVSWLTASPESSVNFTPLHELDGIITPSGLCFERHHGGIADIDPASHRLMIHGLVDKPLVFTNGNRSIEPCRATARTGGQHVELQSRDVAARADGGGRLGAHHRRGGAGAGRAANRRACRAEEGGGRRLPLPLRFRRGAALRPDADEHRQPLLGLWRRSLRPPARDRRPRRRREVLPRQLRRDEPGKVSRRSRRSASASTASPRTASRCISARSPSRG
ncbi:hypothetical protein BTHI11S_00304 [Bosea thiooxidans]